MKRLFRFLGTGSQSRLFSVCKVSQVTCWSLFAMNSAFAMRGPHSSPDTDTPLKKSDRMPPAMAAFGHDRDGTIDLNFCAECSAYLQRCEGTVLEVVGRAAAWSSEVGRVVSGMPRCPAHRGDAAMSWAPGSCVVRRRGLGRLWLRLLWTFWRNILPCRSLASWGFPARMRLA
jgi:hypothetical protein